MKNKIIFIFISFLLTSCSSVIDSQGYTYDPWEKSNRLIFNVNDALDTTVLKPAATIYDTFTPQPVQNRVNDFFGNISDVNSLANSLLQLKLKQSSDILARVVSNSIFGLGGLFDVATAMGNEKIYEDFGTTFEHYGLKSGPYVVLPLFGPSTLRDGIGRVGDIFTTPTNYLNPETHSWILFSLENLQKRTSLLAAERALNGGQGVGDKYLLMRDSWIQYRQQQINGESQSQVYHDEIDAIFEEKASENQTIEQKDN